MILKRLKVDTGLADETNCYIVMDENTKETMVVDPGGDANSIINTLEILNAKLKYILVTHCHGDHIGAIQELRAKCGGRILIHRTDAEGMYNPEISLTNYIGMEDIHLEADSRLDDEDKIHIGKLEFKIIHTPGHTKGSICVYCEKEKLLFSGDTLFRGTWGRTDLPTGSFEDIINSITYKLMKLPDDTIIYPGHGKSSLVGEEKSIYIELKPKMIYKKG